MPLRSTQLGPLLVAPLGSQSPAIGSAVSTGIREERRAVRTTGNWLDDYLALVGVRTEPAGAPLRSPARSESRQPSPPEALLSTAPAPSAPMAPLPIETASHPADWNALPSGYAAVAPPADRAIVPDDSTVESGVPVRPRESDEVFGAVARYAEALTHMDVNEATGVWPSVDRRTLSEAFRTLQEHRVELESCAIDVGTNDRAVATCRAAVEFVPKVGRRVPQVATQQWRFTMQKTNGSWQIENASVAEERSPR